MNHQKQTLESRWRALPKAVRAAFLASLIVGFAVHLFAFANLIPNSDGLRRMYDTQQMTVSGRWFLHYASMLHGFLQAPALIGTLSLLCLGLSAALSADLLEVRSVPGGIGVGAAFVVIPALAYTYLYMFTASAYALAILMAVASVWLVRKKQYGFLPATVLLACSMGTYQAYFAVAAGLALMRVLLDLLDSGREVKQTVRRGFTVLGMLLAAVLVYGLMLRLFLHVKDLELLDYRGIRDAGTGHPARNLLWNLLSAGKQFVTYFLLPEKAFGSPALAAANTVFLVLATAAGVSAAVRIRLWTDPARLGLLLFGLFLLPLACNVTRVMSEMSPNMCYSFTLLYVFGIAVLERGHADAGDRRHSPRAVLTSLLGGEAGRRAAALAFAVTVLVNAQICNLVYTSSATAHRATEVFAANLVSRVEQTPGYRSDLPVIIIGTFPRGVYHAENPMFDPVEHYSCMADTVLGLNKHVYYYLNDWLNIPWEEPDEETMIAVSESEVFAQMPLYPDDGSVRIDGNRVSVKLAPVYIPKQPYEIAYEQRR